MSKSDITSMLAKVFSVFLSLPETLFVEIFQRDHLEPGFYSLSCTAECISKENRKLVTFSTLRV